MILTSKKIEQPELPSGYTIRNFRQSDEQSYIELLNRCRDFCLWTLRELKEEVMSNQLSPNGIYVVIFKGKIAATACGLDRSSAKDKKAELGWVAVDPAHRGKHLAYAVCCRVLGHLINQGYDYKKIFLLTGPGRLAARKTFQELGFAEVRKGERNGKNIK